MLVLCAAEYQPSAEVFPGVRVLHAPNVDADRAPTLAELAIALDAARAVARELWAGGRVLVTCAAGRNRSGLVTAAALAELTGASGDACVRRVQARRPGALTNPHFATALRCLFPVVLR